VIATEIPRLSYLTKLSNPAPLSVGLPMPAACCTTLTDVINVHPMMAFGASVRHSVRAERITGMRTPVTTKESAAATARSTSKVRIDLEKSYKGRRRSGCENELHRKRTFTRLMTVPLNTFKETGREPALVTPTERCLQIGLEGSREPSCSAAGRCPSPRVRA